MIISKKVWKEHDELIKKLMRENHQLKNDLNDLQRFCMNFAASNSKFDNALNLDFPNSKKSYEDKLF